MQASALGDGSFVEPELFQWWSEVIEVPVVAEGALDVAMVTQLTAMTDFFGIGDEIWAQEDAVKALGQMIAAMG